MKRNLELIACVDCILKREAVMCTAVCKNVCKVVCTAMCTAMCTLMCTAGSVAVCVERCVVRVESSSQVQTSWESQSLNLGIVRQYVTNHRLLSQNILLVSLMPS